MAWKPPQAAADYDTLAKQFRALCTLHACADAQLRHYQMDHHHEVQARAQIEGERAANQLLTNEIDRLLAEIDRLRDQIDGGMDHRLRAAKRALEAEQQT